MQFHDSSLRWFVEHFLKTIWICVNFLFSAYWLVHLMYVLSPCLGCLVCPAKQQDTKGKCLRRAVDWLDCNCLQWPLQSILHCCIYNRWHPGQIQLIMTFTCQAFGACSARSRQMRESKHGMALDTTIWTWSTPANSKQEQCQHPNGLSHPFGIEIIGGCKMWN